MKNMQPRNFQEAQVDLLEILVVSDERSTKYSGQKPKKTKETEN